MSKGTLQAAKHGTPKPPKGMLPTVPTIAYTHPALEAPQNPSMHPALSAPRAAMNHPAKKGKTPRTYGAQNAKMSPKGKKK